MSHEPVRGHATGGGDTSAANSARDTDQATRVPEDLYPPPPSADVAAGRYELLDEIAEGGMGAVLRAFDRTLGREVAVKVLQDRYPAGSVIARRFIDEARISGQLQHPGIPPVHDLGTLPDGRPFLAMKLIKGRTLESLLRDRQGPAADRGRFVAVFEAVCQAVAYRSRPPCDSSRPQAVERDGGGLRRSAAHGLGPREGLGRSRMPRPAPPADSDLKLATEIMSGTGRRRVGNAGRQRPGHAGLHGPRAGDRCGRPGGRAERRVRAGGDPGGDPDRRAAVCGRYLRGDAGDGRAGKRGRVLRSGSTPAGPSRNWSLCASAA